jgi:hypothetical protein
MKRIGFFYKVLYPNHPMSIRWQNYYESRNIKLISKTISWNLYSTNWFKKLIKIIHIYLRILFSKTEYVQANDLHSGMLAFHLKSKFGIKYIYTAHEIFSLELPNDLESDFDRLVKRSAEEKIIKNSDIVIVPNHQRVDYFKKVYNLNNTHFQVIENKTLISENCKCSEMIISGLPKKKTVFYGGSFWIGRKQESFDQLAKGLEENKYGLVLGGNNNRYLQSIISNNKNIFYIGNIPSEQYLDFLKHVDICLAWYFPTTKNDELCAPLKIFDYLYSGKPIVAPSLPYITELANVYRGCIELFEPGNYSECLTKILLIANNYQYYIENLKKFDKTEFSWESQYKLIDQTISKTFKKCVE